MTPRHILTPLVMSAVLLGSAACDAPVEIDLRQAAPRAVTFREGHFFPPHRHTVPASADDYAWAHYEQGGGLALGDVDGDGLEDLFVSGGAHGHRLFRNAGRGRFEELEAALPTIEGFVSSATFADVDDDGDDDLLLSHLLARRGLTLLRNDGGTFADTTAASGLGSFTSQAAWSTTFADVDEDGNLDLFVTQWMHWDVPELPALPHVFCGDGRGAFADCAVRVGLADLFPPLLDSSFTATFTDLDEDMDLDLLLAADYARSVIYRNDGGRFTRSPESDLLEIEFGMGAVVRDFDGDHHLDWFVTAIYLPNNPYLSNGNRLMLGDGTGRLRDVSLESGVRDGGWGWGACAEDFDLDGDADVFHVNGYESRPPIDLATFAETDPLTYFENDGSAHFTERAAALGLVDPSITTSAVCADFDGDGDVDIATLQVDGSLRAYENMLIGSNHYVSFTLVNRDRLVPTLGARVRVEASGTAQVRERRIDNTHTSGQSSRLHFGVGTATRVDAFVRWPDGSEDAYRGLRVDRHHTLRAGVDSQ